LATNTTSSAPAGSPTGEFPIGPVTPGPRPLDRFALPGPRTLLAAIVMIRMALAVLLLVRASDPDRLPVDPWVLGAILALAFAATLWLGVGMRGDRIPDSNPILLQATVDVLVVTGLVAFMAGATTPIAALYVALVAAYALLLPVGRGLIAVAFAVCCYVVVTVRSLEQPGFDFWTQVAVIAFVGSLIAVLGNRLANAARTQASLSEALVQARLEADEILATIQSGVITVDGDGKLAYINPRARRILGGEGLLPGQPALEALRARSRDLHDAIERGIRQGARLSRGEASVRRGDGSLFPVGVSTTTFLRPGGGVPSVTAIFTDISDLKRLQEFRLRAERLEAVAALSASLAHEIRNPLAAIRSAVEQLAGSVQDDPDDRVLADLVMRESERLNRLLSEFLDFSRVRATRFETMNLLDVVGQAARFVAEHPEARGVEIAVTGEPVELEADPDLLHRIATNLMLNAAQARIGTGRIRAVVTTAQGGEAPPGPLERRVKLVISDDGPGIPDAVRERLFEPFVTGRPGGSGLGLAIVQRAIAAHRGVILVDSSPQSGTTFTIFLPATWDREDAP
jgi:two-component system sensor histidine kinase PilS (NtrC family)